MRRKKCFAIWRGPSNGRRRHPCVVRRATGSAGERLDEAERMPPAKKRVGYDKFTGKSSGYGAEYTAWVVRARGSKGKPEEAIELMKPAIEAMRASRNGRHGQGSSARLCWKTWQTGTRLSEIVNPRVAVLEGDLTRRGRVGNEGKDASKVPEPQRWGCAGRAPERTKSALRPSTVPN